MNVYDIIRKGIIEDWRKAVAYDADQKEIKRLRDALEVIAKARFLVDDHEDLVAQMRRYAQRALDDESKDGAL